MSTFAPIASQSQQMSTNIRIANPPKPHQSQSHPLPKQRRSKATRNRKTIQLPHNEGTQCLDLPVDLPVASPKLPVAKVTQHKVACYNSIPRKERLMDEFNFTDSAGKHGISRSDALRAIMDPIRKKRLKDEGTWLFYGFDKNGNTIEVGCDYDNKVVFHAMKVHNITNRIGKR
jgi:hypothetical protein